MQLIQAKKLSLELMDISEAAYLTTIDQGGFPQTRAMLNLRNSLQYPGLVSLFNEHCDDFYLYFTTNYSSSKIKQIQANSKSSVYFCLPTEWRGLMLSGEIEIANDFRKIIWQKGWEMYYPGGVDNPDFTILCLRPNYAVYYDKLDVSKINLR